MFRYRAFISYSHSDTRFAARLHRDLESFRLPRDMCRRLGLPADRIGPVFRDVSDLPAAAKLTGALIEALSQCEALIVVCSPSAARSHWVEQEILEFRETRGDAAQILAIIAPAAGDMVPEETFPRALGAQPLAADARASADGRRLALLKIVAGLLGIGLDELVRRDMRRRFTRLAAGASASALTAVTMTILAVLAMSAREDAQRRLSQSEDLIGFMLGDLRSQLAPLGHVRVLESVGDKALEYFESLEDGDLTDEALLRKSRALYQIGDVYFELGQFEAAQTSFELSLEQARRLALAQPDSDEKLYELAQAEFWVGYAAWSAGDLALAEQHLLAYEDAAHALNDRDPANQSWAMEAFYANNNLGSLAVLRWQFADAQRYFDEAISRIDDLIAQSATPDLLFERATVLSWLGSTHLHRGNIEAAREAFLTALSRPVDSTNALHEEERAYELGFLSDIELFRGNLDGAFSYGQEALAIATRLSESDPDSMDLLFGRTAHALDMELLKLYEAEPVDVESLRFAVDKLLQTDRPPASWRLLALRIADIGVRIGEAGFSDWARELLGAEPYLEASRGGVEPEYVQLSVSLALETESGIDNLLGILPIAVEHYERNRDFELAIPLLKAYELLGNDPGFSRMQEVLEAAGSRHPEFLASTAAGAQ